MSETAELNQNPVLPEPPVAQAPAPPITELPLQPPAPESPQPDGATQDEVALSVEIVQLWQVHQDCQSAIKQETQQFRSLRSELGRLLHQMKALLAKPGRGGEWSGWLRERRIPRATADRLVSKYERFLNPDGNCLTAQFAEPTEQEIQNLLDKVAPKLRRVLRTPASAFKFIELLTCLFALGHQATEGGLVIAKPSQKTELAEPMQELQHEPVESPVEPVPVVADAPADANSESMGTTTAS